MRSIPSSLSRTSTRALSGMSRLRVSERQRFLYATTPSLLTDIVAHRPCLFPAPEIGVVQVPGHRQMKVRGAPGPPCKARVVSRQVAGAQILVHFLVR